MLLLHQYVIYPGHGVAQVIAIDSKQIGTSFKQFFKLQFLNQQMTIHVPIEAAQGVGVRPLSSPDAITSELFETLATAAHIDRIGSAVTAVNWNKRSKEYLKKIRTGSVRVVGEIYRELSVVSAYKGLSFGERNLLQRTEELLAEEVALVYAISHEEAIQKIRHHAQKALQSEMSSRGKKRKRPEVAPSSVASP